MFGVRDGQVPPLHSAVDAALARAHGPGGDRVEVVEGMEQPGDLADSSPFLSGQARTCSSSGIAAVRWRSTAWIAKRTCYCWS
jgi:hypothetical protein